MESIIRNWLLYHVFHACRIRNEIEWAYYQNLVQNQDMKHISRISRIVKTDRGIAEKYLKAVSRHQIVDIDVPAIVRINFRFFLKKEA